MKKFVPFLATIALLSVAHAPLQAGWRTESTPKQQERPQDFRNVAKHATPAVVYIETKTKGATQQFSPFEEQTDPFGGSDLWRHFFGFSSPQQQPSQQQMGQGSGFIISQDGYIITNRHLVRDANEMTVRLNDGREFEAKLIGQDPSTDIALIKIDSKKLPHLQLGNSDALEVGEWVVAIGNPFGLQASLTVGVVSATGRNNLDISHIEDFIQTDAALNRGNSGGPLLDINGDVIGMNTAIASSMGGNIGIGFAIPSNMLSHVVDQLKNGGNISRGFMGVVLQPVDKNLAQAFELDGMRGALIADVSKDSPAAKAGIKQGDILLKYNGRSIANIAQLRNAVSMMKPGTTISFLLLREGKEITLPITIGSYPGQEQGSTANEFHLGVQVETITPEIARKYNLEPHQGVMISKVEPGSGAAWAGIRKGSIILEVNRKKVSSVEQFSHAINSTEKGKPTLFLLRQGDTTRYISLKVG